MGVKRKKSALLFFRMTPDDKEIFRRFAERHSRTMTDIMEELLANYIKTSEAQE